MVSKLIVVELEQGGPRGGMAHWAVNPSKRLAIFDGWWAESFVQDLVHACIAQ
jgi:hypothetical protein